MKGREVLIFLVLLLGGSGLRAQPAGDRPAIAPPAEATAGSLPRAPSEDAPACRRLGHPPAAMPPCFGVLTPEERRQLRRDIRQAGQELYLPRPPHPFDGRPPYRRD